MGAEEKSREENKGSRLDYFLVSGELLCHVQGIKHHTTTLCSDHCPISMRIGAISYRVEASDENLSEQWRTIDWTQMEKELFRRQNRLAYAAYKREWEGAKAIQSEIVTSYSAKVLQYDLLQISTRQQGLTV